MAEEGQVISCHSHQQWKEIFERESSSNKLVVVDFTASWCGPCRMIAPILADLAKKKTDVVFVKVDVDEVKEVAEEWSVEAMPTFIFLKNGKLVEKVVGANKDLLLATTEKHATMTV
ncbi:hypothetical protein V2J09_007590 [Rumex salicifolius]